MTTTSAERTTAAETLCGGLGVDVRVVAQAGARVTAAVATSLIVLGVVSLALIRLMGVA